MTRPSRGLPMPTPVLALILALSLPSAQAADHCRRGETAYFACQTRAGKWVSLCAATAADRPTSLHYRFGRPGRVELEYPAAATGDSLARFSYNEYTRPMTRYAEIGFANAGHRYALYERYDGSESARTEHGVSVTAPDGRETTIECAGPVTQRLAQLAPVLHCDTDHAFGCPGR